MNKQNTEVAVIVVMGVAYLYFLHRMHQMTKGDITEIPSKDEVLKAIENAAANLTVTPLTQSEN